MIVTVIFIALFVIILCVCFFALGYELASDKHVKENLELLDKLSSDEEKELNKQKKAFYKDLSQQMYGFLIFCIVLIGFMLAINIWSYREQGMDGLKRGKYGYEEIIRTKTKGNVVKMDTTYNFYRIKPEKK